MLTDDKQYEIEVKFKCWMTKSEIDEVQTKVQELLKKLQETAKDFHISQHVIGHLEYDLINIKEVTREFRIV